jgi:hypothetical protein
MDRAAELAAAVARADEVDRRDTYPFLLKEHEPDEGSTVAPLSDKSHINRISID